MESLGSATDLLGNADNCRPLRLVILLLLLMLDNEPNGALPNFRRVPTLLTP